MQVDPLAAALALVSIVVAIAALVHQVRHNQTSAGRSRQFPNDAAQEDASIRGMALTTNPRSGDTTRAEVSPVTAREAQTATEAVAMALRAPTGRLVEVRGRGELLEVLAGRLVQPDGRFVVLAGLGGVGKTTVALALAERAQVEGRAVWWVSAVDKAAATGCLLGLALELGEVEEARAGLRNPSEVLWTRLEHRTGWLLVVDKPR